MIDFSQYDDLTLLEEIKAGNKLAYNALFRRYSRFLKIEAYFRLKDMMLSEEVVNDVFSKIWLKRLDLVIKGSFKHYLFKAVKNKCIDTQRRMRLSQNMIRSVEENDTDLGFDSDIIENKELGQLIFDAIAQITNPNSKRAFELQYIDNKPQKEIAELMNLSLDNVKQLVSRGLKVVRAFLIKHL